MDPDLTITAGDKYSDIVGNFNNFITHFKINTPASITKLEEEAEKVNEYVTSKMTIMNTFSSSQKGMCGPLLQSTADQLKLYADKLSPTYVNALPDSDGLGPEPAPEANGQGHHPNASYSDISDATPSRVESKTNHDYKEGVKNAVAKTDRLSGAASKMMLCYQQLLAAKSQLERRQSCVIL